jgi:hypothetical protein
MKMGSAKQCDRCGKLYEITFLDDSDYKENWWRFVLWKDMHPYGDVKLDLCNECRKSLSKWFEQGDNK